MSEKENKDKINKQGKPFSQEYFCDGSKENKTECKYSESELFMPGERIPHMFTHKFCPMCGGILRRSNVGGNNKRYKWRD